VSRYRPYAIIFAALLILAVGTTTARAGRRCGCRPSRLATCLTPANLLSVLTDRVPTLAPPRPKSSSTAPAESTRLQHGNTIVITVEAEAVAAPTDR